MKCCSDTIDCLSSAMSSYKPCSFSSTPFWIFAIDSSFQASDSWCSCSQDFSATIIRSSSAPIISCSESRYAGNDCIASIPIPSEASEDKAEGFWDSVCDIKVFPIGGVGVNIEFCLQSPFDEEVATVNSFAKLLSS